MSINAKHAFYCIKSLKIRVSLVQDIMLLSGSTCNEMSNPGQEKGLISSLYFQFSRPWFFPHLLLLGGPPAGDAFCVAEIAAKDNESAKSNAFNILVLVHCTGYNVLLGIFWLQKFVTNITHMFFCCSDFMPLFPQQRLCCLRKFKCTSFY